TAAGRGRCTRPRARCIRRTAGREGGACTTHDGHRRPPAAARARHAAFADGEGAVRRGREPVILISGGGAVGLALAALLDAGRFDVRVHVVEPREVPHWRPEHTDIRVYALSRASQRILERIGAWPAIAGRRACPYERMRVWEGEDPNGAASIGFDC